MRHIIGFVIRVFAGLILGTAGAYSAWHSHHDLAMVQLCVAGLCWDNAEWYYDKHL